MYSIATWNVNSLRVRLPHVLEWLVTVQPDVLALQETKTVDEDFPQAAFTDLGYSVVFSGQKTYNGVATLSRTPPETIATGIPDYEDPQRRVLATRARGVLVVNLYVPNGSEVGSEKYAYKLDWLKHLEAWTRELVSGEERVVLLGDFNIAPADEDVYDPAAWAGQVLCSEPEREAFQGLLATGLVDCFRQFEQAPESYTWWDYRAAAFRRNRGLRIDHILASQGLADRCRACRIDVAPRRLERPSDHTPILAEFDLG